MARSDLLVSLVRAGAAGDSRELATTVEATIAENEVYGSYFPENPPARACVQAGLVKPEFLVEIAATAVIDS